MANSSEDGHFSVGIIGYGMSAKIFHIPFIQHIKSLRLAAIVQRHPSPGNSASADYPSGVKHYTAAADLFSDAAIAVVVLCTPPDTHFALARDALTAGKHLLVEKPFVPSSAEADELVALTRRHQRLICVYQNRRWDADFLTLQALIKSGKLGRVVELDTHFDRFRPQPPTTWKGALRMSSGGGAIYDLGTHLIDQAFVLFGMPSGVRGTFVQARAGRVVHGDDGEADGEANPDGVDALLVYDDTGVLVHVRISIMSVEKRQPRFWLRGTKGSYRKLGLDPQENQLKGGMTLADHAFGREPGSAAGSVCLLGEDGSSIEERPWPNVEPPETYLRFYELFAAALASGREEDVPVPATEAADVLRIIEAVRQSARTGNEVRLARAK